MAVVGFAVWLNRARLLHVWQKAERCCSADLWFNADDLSLFRIQHFMAGRDWDRVDRTSLLCQNLSILRGMLFIQQENKSVQCNSMHRWAVFMGVALTLINVMGCSGMGTQPCGAGQKKSVSETLYFGTGTPDGQISDEQWQTFVDNVITPRFPQGLSIWTAYGQWQSVAGNIIQEDSYVLNVIHDGESASGVAIAEIMNNYKNQFQQEAVLRVESAVCVSY